MLPARSRIALLAAACATALTTAVAPAVAAPPTPSPSPAARAHGVARTGDAYLGWSDQAATPAAAAPGVAAAAATARSRPQGIDVSGHQGRVDWARHWNAGRRFAYVKATEGTGFRNPWFGQQYVGSYRVGMIRGAYHFALPDRSSGRAQASWFVANGGGWSADGRTLPGVLDVEYNPYGSRVCYGLSRSEMIGWIRSFTNRYRWLTGRNAVIYTTTDWWRRCTGNTAAFSGHPLWIARYSTYGPGSLPSGWNYHTFWQHTDRPIDQNIFNGSIGRLRSLALRD